MIAGRFCFVCHSLRFAEWKFHIVLFPRHLISSPNKGTYSPPSFPHHASENAVRNYSRRIAKVENFRGRFAAVSLNNPNSCFCLLGKQLTHERLSCPCAPTHGLECKQQQPCFNVMVPTRCFLMATRFIRYHSSRYFAEFALERTFRKTISVMEWEWKYLFLRSLHPVPVAGNKIQSVV